MFSPSLGKSKSLLHDQGHQPKMQNKEVNDMAIITPVAVTMTTNTAATTTNKIRLL
jgi:fatty acid desaturase